ncbi:MAG: tetratricopeptide repeat protein [Candidatus Hydrogenedentota bacterium]
MPADDDFKSVASFLQEGKGLSFDEALKMSEIEPAVKKERTPLEKFKVYVERDFTVRSRIEKYYWDIKYGKRPYYYAAFVLGMIAVVAWGIVYNQQFSKRARIEKNLNSAELALKNKEYDKLDGYLANTVSLGADRQTIYTNFGLKALDNDLIDLAEKYLNKAIEEQGSLIEGKTLFVLAKVAYRKKNYTEARKKLEEVIATDPANIEARKLFGILMYMDGNLLKAEEAFNDVIALRTNDFGSLYYLYKIYKTRGEWDRLKRIYDLMIGLDYKEVEEIQELEDLGEILANSENYKTAINVFSRVLELKPESIKSIYNLALIYTGQGKSKEAINLVNNAIRLAPHHYLSYNLRGEIYYYKLNDPVRALEDFNTCIRINPLYHKVHYNLAQIYFYETNDYESAIKEYLKTIKLGLHPEDDDIVLYNIAYSYYQLKDYNNAFVYFKRLYEKRKGDLDLALICGNTAFLFKDYKTALDYYRIIISTIPKTPYLVNNMSITYFMMNNKKEALKLMWEAIKMSSQDSKEMEFYSKNLNYLISNNLPDDVSTLLYQKMEKNLR